MSKTPCLWCGSPFQPVKRGDHVKKFCRGRCKTDFETAARRYAYAMIEVGDLSVSDLTRIIHGTA